MKTSADTEVIWLPSQDAIEALLKDSPFGKATEYILPAPTNSAFARGCDQIAFSISSEPEARYTLEQRPRLADLVWTPVETRVGDGATIQFRRPLEAGPAKFFRVRQEP